MILSAMAAALEAENAWLKARAALLEEMLGLDQPEIAGLDLMLKHKLPRQQAEVLRALIAAKGKPLDRYTLEGRITRKDHSADYDLKSLDRLICYLRKKLGSDVIETVHGVGWRINPNWNVGQSAQ